MMSTEEKFSLQDVRNWMKENEPFRKNAKALSHALIESKDYVRGMDQDPGTTVTRLIIVATQNFDTESKKWVLAEPDVDPEVPKHVKYPIWVTRFWASQSFCKNPIEVYKTSLYQSGCARGVDILNYKYKQLEKEGFLIQARKENQREVNVLVSIQDFHDLVKPGDC